MTTSDAVSRRAIRRAIEAQVRDGRAHPEILADLSTRWPGVREDIVDLLMDSAPAAARARYGAAHWSFVVLYVLCAALAMTLGAWAIQSAAAPPGALIAGLVAGGALQALIVWWLGRFRRSGYQVVLAVSLLALLQALRAGTGALVAALIPLLLLVGAIVMATRAFPRRRSFFAGGPVRDDEGRITFELP